MKASAGFGQVCPKCKTRIGVHANIGGDASLCPNCKTPMVPDSNFKGTANVKCKKCNFQFGFINSDKCPNCGTPFE
jgi:DNA-directed RNA polymerase subunit RPC12/RpoP